VESLQEESMSAVLESLEVNETDSNEDGALTGSLAGNALKPTSRVGAIHPHAELFQGWAIRAMAAVRLYMEEHR